MSTDTTRWASECEIKVKVLPGKFAKLRRAVVDNHIEFTSRPGIPEAAVYRGCSLVSYARHKKTNYEQLLDELAERGDDDGQAYEIIKRRCDDAIKAALLQAYGDQWTFRPYLGDVTNHDGWKCHKNVTF